MSDKPLRILWTGHVTDIDDNGFTAQLSNGKDEIIADFLKDELRDCDKKALQVGSYLYWLVFDDSTTVYLNQYQYTQDDIDKAAKAAKKWAQFFDKTKNN